MHKKHVQIKETPYGQGEFACKAKRGCPGAYPFMCKKHAQINERSRFMADLKQYFPVIQDRKEVLAKIHDKVELLLQQYLIL